MTCPVKGVRHAGLCLVLCLAACAVGPDYRRPAAAPAPAAFKEASPAQPTAGDWKPTWKPAQPSDASRRGRWWEIYRDPRLDALENKVALSNQTLAAATAQYLAASQQVRVARAGLYPRISAGPSVTHTREAYNQPNTVRGVTHYEFTTFLLQGQVLWEPDLWGLVRRTVEQAHANAEASAAQLANVELSIQAELATDYIELRGLDTQGTLLANSVASDADYLQLTQVRFHGGVGTEVDVAQAETQYQSVRAQAADLGVARARFEHAIATLIGVPASAFSLPPLPLDLVPPSIPAGLPSHLLERRPDIAGAERRMAAANAGIGIAIAGYYPSITLSGGGGFESGALATWLEIPSLLWSVGASALETIFDAGRRHALTDQARNTYEAQVADYRQSVLLAFAEVEDNLAALRVLGEEAVIERAAVEAAHRSLSISTKRYRGGVTTYLEVLTAQTAQLANERAQADISTRQCVASVALIKALGGGWDTTQVSRL